MPSMMKSRSKRKVLSDLVSVLTDPKQLQEEVKNYDEQIEKRVKAINQKKADAQIILDELKLKQQEHDTKQKELDARHQNYSLWQKDLEMREVQLHKSSKELESFKLQFEDAQKNALKVLQERTNQIAQKEDQLKQKEKELIDKLGNTENKHYELLSRESSVTKREAFLIGVISQLKA